MPNFQEQVSIYTPGVNFAQDRNPVPKAVTLSRSLVACNIHRGTQAAQDQATFLGLRADIAALGYFALGSEADLAYGNVILDVDGVPWVISGRVSKRNRFPATAHCKVVLQRALTHIDGLP